MSKRQLTKQQHRRIRRNQQRQQHASTQPSSADDTTSCSPSTFPVQRGRVIASYGKQVSVESLGNRRIVRCFLRANLPTLVTGDWITWRADSSTDMGIVEAMEPRNSTLYRPDMHGKPRPVAANIDNVVIVIAPEPEPHSNLIDRYLVAITHHKLNPLILLNKKDILTNSDVAMQEHIATLQATYKKLGYSCLAVSATTGEGIVRLHEHLHNKTSILVGQSGVGKSSLLNTLIPDAQTTVGNLSTGAKKGTHTTTTAELFHFSSNDQKTGHIIDSPGIREFGLDHLDGDIVTQGFVEFHPFLGHCKYRNCSHSQEPGCALLEALAAGKIGLSRFESYRMIMQSLTES